MALKKSLGVQALQVKESVEKVQAEIVDDKPKPKKKMLVMELDEELHHKLKLEAFNKSLSMRQIVEELIRLRYESSEQ
jgi:predicted HicB family RNase H-like nuclease